jgi:hypothetical protein
MTSSTTGIIVQLRLAANIIVVAVPYQLLCAVQDMYDLYTRIAPAGPYRLTLFHDPPYVATQLAAPLRARLKRVDALIRGVSCLLGSGLCPAAMPVIAELWAETRAVERAWLQSTGAEPPYYGYVSKELLARSADGADAAYRLFGEVLAVLLDVLAGLGLPGTDGLSPRVRHLRAIIAQTGESASSSSAV